MKLALITPQFAPNMYDFSAILKADRVLLLDAEPWSRKGRTHRTEIRTENGTDWLNLPILTADKKKAIREVRIDKESRWFEPFWNTLCFNYNNAVYLDYYHDELLHDIEMVTEFEKLLDFNLYFFKRMLTYLEVDLAFELASEVPGYSSIPEETMANLGADSVYMEQHSRNYLRQPDRAVYFEASPQFYRQAFPGFYPGCSILDLLLNEGVESYRILQSITR